MRSSYFSQFRDAADFYPFDDEDIAGVIEACAVRADEFAGLECRVAPSSAARGPPSDRLQRPRCVITLFFSSSRVTRASRSGITTLPLRMLKWQGELTPDPKLNMLAVEREVLQSLVGAVRDGQDRAPCREYPRYRPCGHDNCPASLPGAAERANELALLVVLVDVAGTVSVTDVNVAVRAPARDWSGCISSLPHRRRAYMPRIPSG